MLSQLWSPLCRHYSSWAKMQLEESQQLTQWLALSKQEGVGPLTLVFAAGSADGRCNFQRSRNSNCLCVSSSTSLHSAQTTWLSFLFHLSTTFYFALSSITLPLTCQAGHGPHNANIKERIILFLYNFFLSCVHIEHICLLSFAIVNIISSFIIWTCNCQPWSFRWL